jgi:hypothetical protein
MPTQPTPTTWQMAPPAEPPAQPQQANQQANPMAGHVKAIAIIDFVFAGLTFLAALGVIFAFGVAGSAVKYSEQYGTPGFVANMLGAMAFVIGAIFIAVGVLYLLAGLRLLAFKRSGKGLGIAAAVVQVIVGLPTAMGGIGLIPLGAGIYGLIILTRQDTDRLLVNP